MPAVPKTSSSTSCLGGFAGRTNIVMRDGKLMGTRKTAELERRELVRMMIGRDVREQRIGPTQVNEQRVVLKVEGLTKAGKCRDISFELREGEILGFTASSARDEASLHGC